MIKPLKHIGRMLKVLRTFSAYNALSPLNELAENNKALKAALFFVRIINPFKKAKNLRAGERLSLALQELGPAYIKLGQTLATRPDIVGDNLAEDLAHLQDRLAPFPETQVLKAIEEEFKAPASEVFKEFNPNAIAAASIAQVHFGLTHDNNEIAVKILRPGIRRLFARDLETIYWFAGLLERYSNEARRLRLKEVVDTIETSVIAETNLLEEAAAAKTLAANMANFNGYRVPEIYDELTTSRVLTMERIHGIAIHNKAALKAAGHDTSALAQTVVQAFLRQSIEDGFFHADLHQGNLLVESDGTLVAIDFGIMGHLDHASRNFLGEILWGFQQRDFKAIAQVHFDAGYVPENQSLERFSNRLKDIAEPIIDKPIQEISFGHLLAQLMATTRSFSMRTQPQLLMLQRSMIMVEGLALSLDQNANMWRLSRPELIRFVIHEQRLPKQVENILTSLPILFEAWLLFLKTIAPQHERSGKEKSQTKEELLSLVADFIALGILLIISTLTPKKA